MRTKWKYALAGALAGLANGFFGGGGGSVLVPVILPLCILSAAVYFLRGGLDVTQALPYLISGAVGGWAGGKWFKGVRMDWLRRGFGLLLIYGGVKNLL